MKPKIIIVDDHILFNNGLKSILQKDFEVIAQVFDGKEVIPILLKRMPEIVLLDINLPNTKGLELGIDIKKTFPDIKLVYITMYSESAFVSAARDLGADGYILKESDSEFLICALKDILNGQKVYDPKLYFEKTNLHHDDYFAKTYALSKREVEVIRCLKIGKSSAQIAEQLFISYETVKSHKKNIYLKLNINKLVDVVQFAVDQGI